MVSVKRSRTGSDRFRTKPLLDDFGSRGKLSRRIPEKTRHVDIKTAPDRVKAAYETVIAHYEHLHAHRMRASAADGGSAPW